MDHSIILMEVYDVLNIALDEESTMDYKKFYQMLIFFFHISSQSVDKVVELTLMYMSELNYLAYGEFNIINIVHNDIKLIITILQYIV